MADWQINFGFTSNAQSHSAGIRKIKSGTDSFARMVVNEVAIAAAKRSYTDARTAFVRSIRTEVTREVARMARLIGRWIDTPDKHGGPYGQMSFKGSDTLQEGAFEDPVSETYKRFFGGNVTFYRQQSGIKWKPRNRSYLKKKQQEGKGGRWWRYTGGLQDYLSNLDAEDYYASLGPLTVLFTRTPTKTAGDRVTNASTRGAVSKTIHVGRVEVLVFNKITPAMMPGLAQMNPVGSNPLPGSGVAQLLPNTDNRTKLLGKSSSQSASTGYRYLPASAKYKAATGKSKQYKRVKTEARTGSHRPAIDPFISYYLTRAIPNAVWRRTERLVKNTVRRQAFTGTRSSTGAQYEGF